VVASSVTRHSRRSAAKNSNRLRAPARDFVPCCILYNTPNQLSLRSYYTKVCQSIFAISHNNPFGVHYATQISWQCSTIGESGMRQTREATAKCNSFKKFVIGRTMGSGLTILSTGDRGGQGKDSSGALFRQGGPAPERVEWHVAGGEKCDRCVSFTWA
jgi:hypothetical protein